MWRPLKDNSFECAEACTAVPAGPAKAALPAAGRGSRGPGPKAARGRGKSKLQALVGRQGGRQGALSRAVLTARAAPEGGQALRESGGHTTFDEEVISLDGSGTCLGDPKQRYTHQRLSGEAAACIWLKCLLLVE